MGDLLRIIGLLALAGGANAQTQSAFPPSNPVSANATSSNAISSNTADRAAATAPVEKRTQSYDPLLDLPPLPQNKVSLMGGTVVQVDGVLNRITVLPFGSKHQFNLAFDVRSQIERDGKPATVQDIRPGVRVYIDSMLDGTRVFAKTINIRTSGSSGNGHGQILGYDAGSQILTLRDELSDQPVHFILSPATVIRSGNQTRSLADLKPGSLVVLDFGTQQGTVVVHEISLLAETGAVFSFFGRITFIDLSRKLIAVDNQSDGKTYEISLPSIAPGIVQGMHEGTRVSVLAVFDGTKYTARSLSPAASSQRNDQ